MEFVLSSGTALARNELLEEGTPAQTNSPHGSSGASASAATVASTPSGTHEATKTQPDTTNTATMLFRDRDAMVFLTQCSIPDSKCCSFLRFEYHRYSISRRMSSLYLLLLLLQPLYSFPMKFSVTYWNQYTRSWMITQLILQRKAQTENRSQQSRSTTVYVVVVP